MFYEESRFFKMDLIDGFGTITVSLQIIDASFIEYCLITEVTAVFIIGTADIAA